MWTIEVDAFHEAVTERVLGGKHINRDAWTRWVRDIEESKDPVVADYLSIWAPDEAGETHWLDDPEYPPYTIELYAATMAPYLTPADVPPEYVQRDACVEALTFLRWPPADIRIALAGHPLRSLGARLDNKRLTKELTNRIDNATAQALGGWLPIADVEIVASGLDEATVNLADPGELFWNRLDWIVPDQGSRSQALASLRGTLETRAVHLRRAADQGRPIRMR